VAGVLNGSGTCMVYRGCEVLGPGVSMLAIVEDTEKIRTDEYDKFDASVDQVV
jgi:hypothetical protein